MATQNEIQQKEAELLRIEEQIEKHRQKLRRVEEKIDGKKKQERMKRLFAFGKIAEDVGILYDYNENDVFLLLSMNKEFLTNSGAYAGDVTKIRNLSDED